MRTIRHFCDQPLAEHANLSLGQDSAHYLGQVLRLKPGAEVVLFNGDGFDYHCTIEHIEKRALQITVRHRTSNGVDSPLQLHIGQVMSRGERMDYAVQKSSELGVTRLTPLDSERCEVRLKPDRAANRRAHWHKVAISAAEQSGRGTPMAISELQPLQHWVQTVEAERKYVLAPAAAPLATDTTPASVALLIGPEGGLSEQEISAAEAAGFVPLSLGPRVLRTETAPVAAAAIMQWLWGDFVNPV